MDDGFRELWAMRRVHESAPMISSDRRAGKGATRRAHHFSALVASWWARFALPTLRFPAALRVQLLQLLQNRLAHLRGARSRRALGLDIRGAQTAGEYRCDG